MLKRLMCHTSKSYDGKCVKKRVEVGGYPGPSGQPGRVSEPELQLNTPHVFPMGGVPNEFHFENFRFRMKISKKFEKFKFPNKKYLRPRTSI